MHGHADEQGSNGVEISCELNRDGETDTGMPAVGTKDVENQGRAWKGRGGMSGEENWPEAKWLSWEPEC